VAFSQPVAPVWTFTQIPTTITPAQTLAGWSAPFGRPRNGALVDDGVSQRYSRTNYSGKNVPPTIHSFGTVLKPIEMHGRWMDRQIPLLGGATQYRKTWKQFVTDGSVVRMTWGSYLSYQIFIHDIELKIEGIGDVAWQIKAECLLDEQGPVPPQRLPATQAPFDIAHQMYQLFPTIFAFYPQSFGSLLGMLNEISDGLSDLKSAINAPFQDIYNTCSALTSFESAVSSDLTGLLSGITAMQTGILALRGQTDYLLSGAEFLNTPDSQALNDLSGGGIFTGADVVSFTAAKQQSDIAMAKFLALLAQMYVQVEMVRRGTPTSAYVAQAGDTWESAAERLMGSADGGRQLRAMNGIVYGQLPVPGVSYSVPG
jgi:hypothetical protein